MFWFEKKSFTVNFWVPLPALHSYLALTSARIPVVQCGTCSHGAPRGTCLWANTTLRLAWKPNKHGRLNKCSNALIVSLQCLQTAQICVEDWRELLSRCCFRSVRCRLGQLRRVAPARLSFKGSFWTRQCWTGAGSARSGFLGLTSWFGPCSSGLFWGLALTLSVLGLGFLLSLQLMVGQKFWLSFWFHELTGYSGAGFLLSHQRSDFRLRSRKIWACFSMCNRWPCWVSAAWRLWSTKVQAIFETACSATLRSNWLRRTIPSRR